MAIRPGDAREVDDHAGDLIIQSVDLIAKRRDLRLIRGGGSRGTLESHSSVIDLLPRERGVGRLPIRGALRRRNVAPDADESQCVVVLDLVRLIVPERDHTDAARHEQEQYGEQGRGTPLAARARARRIRTAGQRRSAPRHELEADGHRLPHRLGRRRRRGADRLRDVRTAPPHGLDARADAVGDQYLRRLRPLRLRQNATRRGARGGHLDEDRRDTADHAIGDSAVVDVLRRRARVERDRGVLQRFGTEALDQTA